MSWYDRPDDRRPPLDDELRAALGGAGADFDYDSLVAGTKARAGRIRRRRALTQGAAAALLVPTLLGTGYVLEQRLSVQDGHEDVAVASQPTLPDPAVTEGALEVVTQDVQGTTEEAAQPEPTGVAAPEPAEPEATEPEVVPPVEDAVPAPTGEEPSAAVETTEPAPDPEPSVEPEPTQDQEPTQDPEPGPAENAVVIPDVVPTGIAFLDALGPAQLDLAYPRVVPLPEFTSGNLEEPVQIEPHSGRTWMFYAAGNEIDQDAVQLTVSGWVDSRAAMTALRGDQTGFNFRTTPDDLGTIEMPWTDGTTGSADRLLVGEASPVGGWTTVGAVVRQGDFLVGVTVTAATPEEASATAVQIAEAAAASLAAPGVPG